LNAQSKNGKIAPLVKKNSLIFILYLWVLIDMKKVLPFIAMLMLFDHLCFANPMPNFFPPFRITVNLYYVGTDDLASYLIVTPK
jgi:hypothetical protein